MSLGLLSNSFLSICVLTTNLCAPPRPSSSPSFLHPTTREHVVKPAPWPALNRVKRDGNAEATEKPLAKVQG